MPLPQKNDCSSGSVVVVGGAQLISNIDRVTANLWHVFMTIWNNNRKKNYKLLKENIIMHTWMKVMAFNRKAYLKL